MYTREGNVVTLSPTHLYLSSLFMSSMGQYVTLVLFSWDLGFKKPNSLLLPLFLPSHKQPIVLELLTRLPKTLLCVTSFAVDH